MKISRSKSWSIRDDIQLEISPMEVMTEKTANGYDKYIAQQFIKLNIDPDVLVHQQQEINRLQAEIKELEAEIDRQYEQAVADIKGNMADGGASCHWCIDKNKAEAIKDFAKKFDEVLAEMREAYFEDDHVSYGLVCETVRSRLSMFTEKMVGENNG